LTQIKYEKYYKNSNNTSVSINLDIYSESNQSHQRVIIGECFLNRCFLNGGQNWRHDMGVGAN